MVNSFNDIEDFLIDQSFRSWVLNPTPELDFYWNAWIDDNADKTGLLLQAKEIISRINFEEFEVDYESKERILNQIKFETSDWNKPKRSINLTYWLRAAAVVVFAVMLGVLTNHYSSQNQQTEVVAKVEMLLKENPYGVRTQHELSDGTRVFLNAGSQMQYPSKFGTNSREVVLSGEAYFEVAKDASRPFIVNANGLEVEVLGTKFNFITYLGKQSVALLEGSVNVSEILTNKEVILKPGQEVTLHSESNEFIVDSFDEQLVFGWTVGKLVFQEASFEEVKARLEKWYGINISVTNPPTPSEWSYTGSFNNQSLKSVLLNMSIVRAFEYKVSNDSVRMDF